MNLMLTSIALAILSIIIYRSAHELLLSPALVFTLSFLLGTSLCFVNPDWDFDIDWRTSALIVLVCVSFSMGHFITRKIRLKIGHYSELQMGRDVFEGKDNLFFFTMVLQVVFLIVYASFIVQIGGGFNAGFLSRARSWMLHHDVPNSVGLCHLMSKVIAMGYVYITVQDYQKKHKIRARLLIPIVLYLAIEVLSTSRAGIIYFLGYVLVVITISSQVYSYSVSRKSGKSVIRTIMLFSIIVLALFIILGNLTGKTAKLGVWNMVATYFGGSIYALDWYLERSTTFSSPLWGFNSFPIISSVRSAIGLTVPIQDVYYFPFVDIPSNKVDNLQRVTNLYTSIGKPFCDFGYFGVIAFYFFLGLVYAYIFHSLRRRSINSGVLNPSIIYLGYFMMPVICSGPQYVFGAFLFSPMAIYQLVFIFIFIHIWVKKQSL